MYVYILVTIGLDVDPPLEESNRRRHYLDKHILELHNGTARG